MLSILYILGVLKDNSAFLIITTAYVEFEFYCLVFEESKLVNSFVGTKN
jgi:hypothetical protein